MRKLLLSAVAIAIAAWALPGSAQTYTFALVPKNMNNPFFDQARDGCKKAEKELGGAVKCEYIGPPEHGGGEEQVQIVNDLIARKVDGIAVAPSNAAAMARALKGAQEAGIPVITWDSDVLEKDKGMRRRKAEIAKLTEFLAERAASERDSDAGNFFIVLGDFNIVDKEHGTMKALESNGFTVPKALKKVPGSNVDKSKSYDQIAYWTPPKPKGKSEALGVTKVEVGRAGVFDFFETVFRRGRFDPDGTDEAYYTPIMEEMHAESGSTGKWKYKDWRTFQMSDHLPMWVELRVDFGDDYLDAIAKE